MYVFFCVNRRSILVLAGVEYTSKIMVIIPFMNLYFILSQQVSLRVEQWTQRVVDTQF